MSALVLLTDALPLLLAALAGAAAGGLTAWWLVTRASGADEQPKGPESTDDNLDPFVAAAIDAEALRWSEAHDQPAEAAGLLAARLKTLQKIGHGKGWF